MSANPLSKMVFVATLLCFLQGGPASAQTPPPEVALGFTSFHLRPESGADQRLNGVVIEGRYSFNLVWSLEGLVSRETGTEADANGDSVALRQQEILVGPRYSHPWSAHWQWFAHLLVGRGRQKKRESRQREEIGGGAL